MEVKIRSMNNSDWNNVASIYEESIADASATFRSILPTFEEWNASHLKTCRLIAECNNKVAGFAAITKTSGMPAFDGVVELSIYIARKYKRQGIGRLLLNALISESEKNGFWTLQSNIFEENVGSIELHKKCGFRIIGKRERVARDKFGKWRTNVLMERRSNIVGMD